MPTGSTDSCSASSATARASLRQQCAKSGPAQAGGSEVLLEAGRYAPAKATRWKRLRAIWAQAQKLRIVILVRSHRGPRLLFRKYFRHDRLPLRSQTGPPWYPGSRFEKLILKGPFFVCFAHLAELLSRNLVAI